MTIDSAIQHHLPAIVELRHRLHQVPEVNYEEHKTAAAIRAELDRLGVGHVDGVAGAPTATVAVIGDKRKPCIALRADIDGLPITENTRLPYASTHSGRMHACGHDGHAAGLVGVAAVLKSIEDTLPVCVKLLWQPAEEGGGGAERMVKAGVLDGRVGPKVEAIFGVHGWPGLNVGSVATRSGVLLAAVDNFAVTFVGQGCHGAFPHMGHDPIVAACEAVLNLQQIVSRELDPTEAAVVTVGTIQAGTAVNVIPDSAKITGTVRTLSEPARRTARAAFHRRCSSIAAAQGCEARVEWFESYPPTINDSGMADYVARVAKSTFGPGSFLGVARPCMGGEDFAYYLEKVPGCFFLVGLQPPGCKEYPPLHSDRYDFADAALPVAIRMFVSLAMSYPKVKED